MSKVRYENFSKLIRMPMASERCDWSNSGYGRANAFSIVREVGHRSQCGSPAMPKYGTSKANSMIIDGVTEHWSTLLRAIACNGCGDI